MKQIRQSTDRFDQRRVAGVGQNAARETPELWISFSSPGHPPRRFGRPAGPIGAALTEVLIALLIMGIGLVSAATMFPIAVLRTVQATQLTRSTVLCYNAESLLYVHPQLIDHASPPNPVPGPGNHIPLPAAGKVTTAVVDPLGYYLVGDANTALRTVFGGVNDVRGNQIVDPAGAPTLLRRVNVSDLLGPSGTPTSRAVIRQAEQLVTLPDSWSVQLDDVADTVTSPTATSFTFPSRDATLLGSLPSILASGGTLRVTLFHSSGRKSIVRRVTGVTGNRVDWASSPVLPAEYMPPATKIERAVVETRNRHYTWMMTVRKDDSGVANINVVVFFNRAHEPSDESVFTTIPANTLSSQFQIDIPATATRPVLRRGRYLFDPVNARWYRITKVTGEQTNTPTITIDRTPTEKIRYAVFLPRVVDVFPINTRVVP